MNLTPGEKAVLAQIRVLYKIARERDQQLKALQMQWTPSHYDAYQRAFGGLLEKQLVEDAGVQSFSITDSGLRTIGISAPRPVVHAVVVRNGGQCRKSQRQRFRMRANKKTRQRKSAPGARSRAWCSVC
jgi:hypothetical protein